MFGDDPSAAHKVRFLFEKHTHRRGLCLPPDHCTTGEAIDDGVAHDMYVKAVQLVYGAPQVDEVNIVAVHDGK